MSFAWGFFAGVVVATVSSYWVACRAIQEAVRVSFEAASEAVAKHHREVEAMVGRTLP